MAVPGGPENPVWGPGRAYGALFQQHSCDGYAAPVSAEYGHQLQTAVAAQQQRLEELQQQRNHLLERIQMDRLIRAKEAAAKAEVLQRVLKQQEVDQRWRCRRNEQLREQALEVRHWRVAHGSQTGQSETRLNEQLQKVKQVMIKHAEGSAQHSLDVTCGNCIQVSDSAPESAAASFCRGRAEGPPTSAGSTERAGSDDPPEGTATFSRPPSRVIRADTRSDANDHSGRLSEASPIPERRLAREPPRLQLLALQYEEELARLTRSDTARRTELLRSNALSSSRVSVAQSADASSELAPSPPLSSIDAPKDAVCNTLPSPANPGQISPRDSAAGKSGERRAPLPTSTAPLSPIPVQADAGGGSQPCSSTAGTDAVHGPAPGPVHAAEPPGNGERSDHGAAVAAEQPPTGAIHSSSPRECTTGASPPETRLDDSRGQSTANCESNSSRPQGSHAEATIDSPPAASQIGCPRQCSLWSSCETKSEETFREQRTVKRRPSHTRLVGQGRQSSKREPVENARKDSEQSPSHGGTRQSCDRMRRANDVKRQQPMRWKDRARDILRLGKTGNYSCQRGDESTGNHTPCAGGCSDSGSRTGRSGNGNPCLGDEDDIELLLRGL